MRRDVLTDLRCLVDSAAELGLDAAYARAVRGPEAWSDLDVPERIRRGTLLWRHALERCGPDVGVRLAELHTPDHLGALGIAMRTADTFGGACDRLLRYQELFFPMPMWRLRREEAVTLDLVWGPPLEADVLRASREMAVALIVALGRQLADVRPLAVRLPHDPAPVASAFVALAGVSPDPGEPGALVYADEVWDRPLSRPDRAVSSFVLAELDALAARTRAADGFVEQLRHRIRRRLPSGPPPMTELARELATTERTLRRRLEAVGTTYAALVDRTREEVARELVRGTDHALSEVAYLLGFSEPSAFHRAFKRWTGETPARFRGI